ncbi:MAG: pentapeptide repeat-containing protein [Leptolyngbya sp. SIOISBB]|nr:pentapeptide repeat-containing protein [Leptolyngbya sp. SIOISBB]
MKTLHVFQVSIPFLLLPIALGNLSLASSIDYLRPTTSEEIEHFLRTRTCAPCLIAETDLSRADLLNAFMKEARIEYSVFIESNLTSAYLRDAYILDSDLSDSILDSANLEGIGLRRVFIDNASLIGVNFQNSEILGGLFRNSNLDSSNFNYSNLIEVNFSNSNLSNVNFEHAKFGRVTLLGADLTGADLNSASFENVIYDAHTKFPEGFHFPEDGVYFLAPYASAIGVDGTALDLTDQNLEGIDISDSHILGDFSRTILDYAILENANLGRSNLTYASLAQACLINARFVRTNLAHTNLRGADIRNTNLRGSILDGADFDGAIYNEGTLFPAGFDPIAAGAILSDDAVVACKPLD